MHFNCTFTVLTLHLEFYWKRSFVWVIKAVCIQYRAVFMWMTRWIYTWRTTKTPAVDAAHRTAYSHWAIPVKRKAHRHVDTIKSNTMTNIETTYSIIEWFYFWFLHSSTMNIHIFWLIWPKSSVYRKDLSLKSTAIAIEVSMMFFVLNFDWMVFQINTLSLAGIEVEILGFRVEFFFAFNGRMWPFSRTKSKYLTTKFFIEENTNAFSHATRQNSIELRINNV